jgi:Ca2+-binding EF-hand superfamily protein
MISEVDEDADGEISFEEFEKMMNNIVTIKATK